jgi:hypothetical protein
MIERGIGAHAHEFLRADLNDGNAGIVVKVRNDMIGHLIHPEWQWRRTQSTGRGRLEMPRVTPSGVIDSRSPGRSFAHVNSTQSCPREKPFFRRVGCVLKTAYHLEWSDNIRVPG